MAKIVSIHFVSHDSMSSVIRLAELSVFELIGLSVVATQSSLLWISPRRDQFELRNQEVVGPVTAPCERAPMFFQIRTPLVHTHCAQSAALSTWKVFGVYVLTLIMVCSCSHDQHI